MKAFKIITLLLVTLLANSISARADTVDNFQIYIKKALKMNDSGFGSARKGTNLLLLTKSDLTDNLSVNYNHCTPGAKKRRIKLISDSKSVIYEWAFSDKEVEPLMLIPISQLNTLLLSKVNVSLYYYDEQVPAGTFLTSVAFK